MEIFQQLTEEDLKRLAEEEYYRLESKFRLSEVKNQSYPNKIKAILCQQAGLLNILESEKNELITNVNVTALNSYKGLEELSLSKVYLHIEEEKKLDDCIRNEKSQIKDLKAEIDKVKKDIITFNKTEVHERKITESVLKSAQRTRDQEDKLQVATNKFNSMLTQNTIYRKRIEVLLNDRRNFFKSYMQLYKQLQHGKQIMLDLVEQATSTYDQREEALKKLDTLKEKTRAEKRIQSKDVRDLKRKLENAENLYAFLSVKGQKRILADLEAKEAREKKKIREDNEEKLGKYIKLLSKIKNLSDERDIIKFATRFKKSEEENMGLFNCVNEINNEVEALQTQVTVLIDRIDEVRASNEKLTQEQQELIECLSSKLSVKEITYETEMNTVQTFNAALSDLLINIERMFQEFECDPKPILALLGNNAHVNEYDVLFCLKLLEAQLYELIYVTFAKEKNVPREDLLQGSIIQEDFHMIISKRPMRYQLPDLSPCPLCVETERIFVLDENNESDTLEEQAYVRAQLMAKVMAEGNELNEVLHDISTCRLPRSRAIMQARFQEQD